MLRYKNELLVLVFAFICVQNSFCQSGSNDANFYIGTGVTGGNNLVTSVILQDDNKILIAGGFSYFNGSLRGSLARLNPDGSLDNTFVSSPWTARINAMALLNDGRIVIVGMFTEYDGVSRNKIAVINSDGTLDLTFDPGNGANDDINTVVVQPDGKIVIGGSFTSYDGMPRNRIARLNADGSIDTSFDIGNGANSNVRSISLQNDDKIIIGGWFTQINGINRNYIARLNPDGSLDTGFNPGSGANNWVEVCTIQPDGKIIIGGLFTQFAGSARKGIARLNIDGSIDQTFNPGNGLNGNGVSTALAIASTADNKLLVGGQFTEFNGLAYNRIVRLNTDGSADTTFIPAPGASAEVLAIAIQPDEKIVIGGNFSNYGGLPRNKVARIYGCQTPPPQPIFTGWQDDITCPGTEQIFGTNPASQIQESFIWTLPDGWSGNSPNPLAVVASAGTHGGTVSVIAYSPSCGNSQPQTLEVSGVVPDICLVTVDSLSTHNIILWEKPETTKIDSFIIYREVTANNFQRVGAVAYSEESVFHDYEANPNVTNYRYKLSTYSCDQEWQGSLYHSSIHLQNLGNGNLLWAQYVIENQQNPVDFYRVYRDDFGTNDFQPIASTIPGGNFTFTDINYSTFPNARYVVDVNWGISCTPFRDTESTTRSNVLSLNPDGVEEWNMNKVSVYPNPANETVTVEFSAISTITELEITNMLGEIVYSESLSGKAISEKQIDVSTLADGVYTLRIKSYPSQIFRKIIRN